MLRSMYVAFVLWYISKLCSRGSFTGTLTLSWWRSLSYRNQFIDLKLKSVDWFLYDKDLRRERVKKQYETSFYMELGKEERVCSRNSTFDCFSILPQMKQKWSPKLPNITRLICFRRFFYIFRENRSNLIRQLNDQITRNSYVCSLTLWSLKGLQPFQGPQRSVKIKI